MASDKCQEKMKQGEVIEWWEVGWSVTALARWLVCVWQKMSVKVHEVHRGRQMLGHVGFL